MSLQRIFESARKMGVPMIVTDVAGREPMVVVSLEQFEAMAGLTATPSAQTAPAAPVAQQPTYSERKSEENVTLSSQQSQKTQQNDLEQILAVEQAEIPLEERFYFETPEDGSAV